MLGIKVIKPQINIRFKLKRVNTNAIVYHMFGLCLCTGAYNMEVTLVLFANTFASSSITTGLSERQTTNPIVSFDDTGIIQAWRASLFVPVPVLVPVPVGVYLNVIGTGSYDSHVIQCHVPCLTGVVA